MGRGIAIVFIPAFILIFGIIYVAMPPPLPFSAALGCYKLPALPLIRITAKSITVDSPGQQVRSISFERGKPEIQILADKGFQFEETSDGGVAVVDANPMGQIIGVIKRRNKRPALTMLYPVEIPQIDCPPAF